MQCYCLDKSLESCYHQNVANDVISLLCTGQSDIRLPVQFTGMIIIDKHVFRTLGEHMNNKKLKTLNSYELLLFIKELFFLFKIAINRLILLQTSRGHN